MLTEVTINGSALTIRGEKKHRPKEEDENYYLGDRYYGSFNRTFQLPSSVDADKAEANVDKGVLIISVPKVDDARRKIIEIKHQ